MGVYVKTLLIAAIVVALTTSALMLSRGAAVLQWPWASALIAVAGLVIVALVLLAMNATAAPRRAPSLLEDESRRSSDMTPDTPSDKREVLDDRALLAFVDQIMAGTTTEALLTTVQAMLPPLIGGRRVWMVSELQKRHSGEQPPFAYDTALTSEVQEWTTFPLRLNDRSVGLLGVESAGGLGTDRHEILQKIAPLLARAVSTVGTIEDFREAGLVDLLTGAATRREGLDRLNAEVKRAQRMGTSMAVLMIDLDHFKSVNDQFGHAVGDALLTAIGRTLRGTLRASDIRCRWGGEEFLIVLPDTDLARAQVVAGHLLHNIASAYVPTPTGPVTTTASIGLTISRPAETAVNALVARADLALYRAKREGRSCVRVVLGDHEGKPIGTGKPAADPAPPPKTPALPFPDRRNSTRSDRRRVPSLGRRRTDPAQSEQGPDSTQTRSGSGPGRSMAGTG